MAPAKLHYGPTRISIYADGYVRAENTACGTFLYDSEDPPSAAAVRFDPAAVTCLACRKTENWRRAAGGEPPKPVNILHMRTSVYRKRGAYDEEANRLLRQSLGLTPLTLSSEQRAAVLAAEDRKHAEYAERGARAVAGDRTETIVQRRVSELTLGLPDRPDLEPSAKLPAVTHQPGLFRRLLRALFG